MNMGQGDRALHSIRTMIGIRTPLFKVTVGKGIENAVKTGIDEIIVTNRASMVGMGWLLVSHKKGKGNNSNK